MPSMKRPVRIVQRSTRDSLLINLPREDTGWNDGDVIRYEIVDADTILIKRMH